MQKATPQECLPNLRMIPALLPLLYARKSANLVNCLRNTISIYTKKPTVSATQPLQICGIHKEA